MARKKSFIRRWATGRRLRWLLARMSIALVPGLARPINFVYASVDARTLASDVFCDQRSISQLAVNSSEKTDILVPSSTTDTGITAGILEGKTGVTRLVACLERCELHAHTGALVHTPTFHALRLDSTPPNWNHAKVARLVDRQLGPGVHLYVDSSAHYYHFFANSIIPLLRAFRDGYLVRNASDMLTLWIPEGANSASLEVLEKIVQAHSNITLNKVANNERLIGGVFVLLVEIADNCEWMQVDCKAAHFLKQILCLNSSKSVRENFLFLDRGVARLRRILNRDVINGVLDNSGYHSFIAHSGNFGNQVKRFDAASHVVAVHGAGLTNLLFCQPGTKVLEIFPSNFIKSTFLRLAKIWIWNIII